MNSWQRVSAVLLAGAVVWASGCSDDDNSVATGSPGGSSAGGSSAGGNSGTSNTGGLFPLPWGEGVAEGDG